MLIAADKVVTFHYRVSAPGHAAFEESYGEMPVVYLQGHDHMLPGLDEALAGRRAGDRFTVTLAPDKAYGLRRDDAIQRISLKHVVNPGIKKMSYKPGTVVRVNTDTGPQDVTVVKAGLKTIDIDTNHPLAGKTVTFEVEVVDVRDATAEEIQHGHAHGKGGHPH